MKGLKTLRKGWALLGRFERSSIWLVFGVVATSALFSAAMVGSVMPFLSVLAAPAQIHEVSVLTWLYEKGGFGSNYSFVVALGFFSLSIIIFSNSLSALRAYVVTHFAETQRHMLSRRLLASYLHQPYEFFLNRNSGEMGTQILSEAEKVVQNFFRPIADVIAATLTVVAILVVLVWVNPLVAIASLTIVGGVYGTVFAFSRRLVRQLGKRRAAANKERFGVASEVFGGVKDIKLLGCEQAYISRYDLPSRRMASAQIGVNVISQTPQFVMQVVALGGLILLSLILLDEQALATGEFLGEILPLLGVFAFAAQRLIPELSSIYRGLTQLNYGIAAVDAVHFDLIESQPRILDAEIVASGGSSSLGLKRQLSVENVTYSYPESGIASLNNVSITIFAGEKIGIVGSTGAGKTTFADILLGLLRPTYGVIRADDIEISSENLRAWQQTVGYVPQDIFLADASIGENIALGVPSDQIDTVRLREVAKIAQVDQFIMHELPMGYDTKAGERGARLSGGQRQRIGIARALYHDADLIVFDEATSALDNLTERDVIAAIDALPGDMTVLMIAHRLSTVKNCDRIMVFDSGHLVACDSWEKLLAEQEAFRRIAITMGDDAPKDGLVRAVSPGAGSSAG